LRDHGVVVVFDKVDVFGGFHSGGGIEDAETRNANDGYGVGVIVPERAGTVGNDREAVIPDESALEKGIALKVEIRVSWM
jgi:hypothetical protein